MRLLFRHWRLVHLYKQWGFRSRLREPVSSLGNAVVATECLCEEEVNSLSARFHFPRRSYVSRRDGRWLFFSDTAGSGVIVNRAGFEVLEACRGGGTAAEIALRLAGEAGASTAVAAVAAAILPFLERMVALGFLAHEILEESAPGAASHVTSTAVPCLKVLYLHVTDRCNLRCKYCYNAAQRRDGLRRRSEKSDCELSTAQWQALIDQAVALGAEVLVVTGGEPLLRDDLFVLGKYARGRGLHANLLTNGTLITAVRAEEIAAAFDSAIVSIDSYIKEEQELMRPGASLDRVLAGIRNLHGAGIGSLALRPVVSNVNVHSLPGFPAYAREALGCGRWSLANCIPNSAEELRSADRFVEASAYQQSIIAFRAALGQGEGASHMLKDDFSLEGSGSCGAAGSVLSIAANGDVYPCQNLHFPEFLAGNITTETLAEMVERSPALVGFRRATPPWFDDCKSCALSTVCGAVCRVYAHNFAHEQDLFFERMCPVLRADVDAKLWHEAARCGPSP